MSKMYITWDQISEFVEHVAKIVESKYSIDGVYGIPRGGLVFAVMLSHRLKVPMLMSPTSNSLIVDDICDSGESILHYYKNTSNPNSGRPIIATMFYKENQLGVKPDIYLYTKTDDWIVYPFEYDTDRT